jgi:hypothetical protein
MGVDSLEELAIVEAMIVFAPRRWSLFEGKESHDIFCSQLFIVVEAIPHQSYLENMKEEDRW